MAADLAEMMDMLGCRHFGHATCKDYRASARIYLERDRADRHKRLRCELLALWNSRGLIGRLYDRARRLVRLCRTA